jgi:hypothetical protein
MSCGKLHEPGQGFHLHAPGEEHGEELADGIPGDEDATGGIEDAPKSPGWVKTAAGHMGTVTAAAWARHGYLVKPFTWIPAVEGSEWLISQVYGTSPLHALAAAGVAAAVGEVATEAVNHVQHRAGPVRARSRVAVAAAGACMAVGGAGIFDGPVMLGTLVVGSGVGGMLAWEKHKAHRDRPAPRPAPPAEIEAVPPPPDPRMIRFITRFCQPGGPLDGATAGDFRELPHGFMLSVYFAADDAHSMASVEGLAVSIAKLYDTTRDEVTVEHIPGNRSENCCQVIVLKTPVVTAAERRAERAVSRWDGGSTWNPETGTWDIGLYIDGTVARYQQHKPGSGAMMGEFGGVPDSGKTGALHVAAAEAGIAMLCSQCRRAGNKYSPGLCGPGQCDMHRVMAVWMGDAQEQGMAVWNGRADLTGWGVEGCLELLEFADQVYEARGKQMAGEEWWDADPFGCSRHNIGKGFFDIAIENPLIDITIDEWPVLVLHPDPEIRARAQQLLVRAVTLWRKRGLKPKIAAQTLDLTLIGAREIREIMAFFNVVAMRMDAASSSMGGIRGDARKLSPNTPGAGFINGPDRRDSTEFTVKFCPEVNRRGETGIDIRHMAGIIQQTPIRYDAATLSVRESWGIEHQAVFDTWKGPDGSRGNPEPAAQQAPAAVITAPAPAPVPSGQAPAPMAYKEHADAALAALTARAGTASFYELMTTLDLAAGPLDAALGVLVGNCQVIRISDEEYKAA